MGDSHQILLAVIKFNEEGKEGNHLLCYFPFGWGQRSCIGVEYYGQSSLMTLYIHAICVYIS